MPYVNSPSPTPQPSHASGTLIEVPGGQKPVEALVVGDLVRTKDNGFQPIRWIASRRLTTEDIAADPALRPMRIRAGALGEARPSRDLVVSQQHHILIDDWRCEYLFGEDQMLAPARALLNDSTIIIDRTVGEVTYYHFMFDAHQIVYSNGVETESFHPATAGPEMLGADRRAELFKLFPQLEHNAEAFGPLARATLLGHEVEVLMSV